jgi:Fur family peroxide stress response transcriptional regulator
MVNLLFTSLRDAGLRQTPQRLAICKLLADTPNHPSAQDIYDELRSQFPSLSLTTVYNTLDALVELGTIDILGTDAKGAVRYDPNTSPHVNLLCIHCNRIIDLPSRHIQSLQEEVAQQSHYRLLRSNILFYGICEHCDAQGAAAS